MEAKQDAAPNLPDPGKAAQPAWAEAKLERVFTPLKQNIELLVAGVIQPLTQVVKFATWPSAQLAKTRRISARKKTGETETGVSPKPERG